MISVKTLTESITVALTDEYLPDIEAGTIDVYSVDGRHVRVAEWDGGDNPLDKPARRFRIKVEEVEVN